MLEYINHGVHVYKVNSQQK